MTNKRKFLDPSAEPNKNKLTSPTKHKSDSKLCSPLIEDDQTPSICFQYYDSTFTSIYDLRKSGNDLKKFDKFIQKFSQYDTWDELCRSCDLKHTDPNKTKARLKKIGINSKQIQMIHLRASDKFRVHGIYLHKRFKLIWIDPNHKIDRC